MKRRAIAAFVLLLMIATALLLGAPCLEVTEPVAQIVLAPGEWLGQDTPDKEPPFIGGLHLPQRWGYSDLVCTGVAEPPQLTGKIERLGGYDRDQLSARVTLETCFKGTAPAKHIVVLGDSVTTGDPGRGGILYAGPPPGFLSSGRNLLFLRKTSSPSVWRVTLPVYECAIPLADTAPHYKLDGSEDNLREALGAEIMAVIRQGYTHGGSRSLLPAVSKPEFVLNLYGNYVFEIYGEQRALREIASLRNDPRQSLRRAVALVLLGHGDQTVLPEVIALLRDKNEEPGQRENAAWALQRVNSPQVDAALWLVAREPINDPVHLVVREVLEARLRRSQ